MLEDTIKYLLLKKANQKTAEQDDEERQHQAIQPDLLHPEHIVLGGKKLKKSFPKFLRRHRCKLGQLPDALQYPLDEAVHDFLRFGAEGTHHAIGQQCIAANGPVAQ